MASYNLIRGAESWVAHYVKPGPGCRLRQGLSKAALDPWHRADAEQTRRLFQERSVLASLRKGKLNSPADVT